MKATAKFLMTLALFMATTTLSAQNTEKVSTTEVMNYLKECGVFFLATVEADQPRVRPFSAVTVYENHLYFLTGKKKDVFKQLKVNGKFEICGLKRNGTEWIRITGKLINDDRVEAKQFMLDKNPGNKMYSATDNNTAVLYIQDGTATYYSFASAPRTVKF